MNFLHLTFFSNDGNQDVVESELPVVATLDSPVSSNYLASPSIQVPSDTEVPNTHTNLMQNNDSAMQLKETEVLQSIDDAIKAGEGDKETFTGYCDTETDLKCKQNNARVSLGIEYTEQSMLDLRISPEGNPFSNDNFKLSLISLAE